MFYQPLRKPRPLGRVILLSIATLMLFYGGYQWIIPEELRRYNGYGWSCTLCLLPIVLSVAIPQVLWKVEPDVPRWLGWGFLLGVIWIDIVHFRLCRTVNALYRRDKLQEPLKVWWLCVRSLNLSVSLRQIYLLSQYWLTRKYITVTNLGDKNFPLFFANA